LKYNIREIGVDGSSLSRDLDAAYVTHLLGGSGVETADTKAGARLQLELTRMEETVFVRGEIKGHFSVACARCLEPAAVSVDEPHLALTFLPRPQETTPEHSEEELGIEDLDTYTHDGLQIDLEPIIREQMILAIPITPLCHPDCKGFCTGCGVNLNHETCQCDDEEVVESTPWTAALKKLKKNAEGG
jgi:uncharacterized protein